MENGKSVPRLSLDDLSSDTSPNTRIKSHSVSIPPNASSGKPKTPRLATTLELVKRVSDKTSGSSTHSITKDFRKTLEKIKVSDPSKTEFRVRKPLTQLEFQYLIDALSQNSTITTLELTGTRCGEHGAKELGEVLKKNTVITHLEMHRNQIGDQGAYHLLHAIMQNLTILKVDLEQDVTSNQSSFRHIEKLFDTLNLVKIDQQKSSVFTPIRNSTKRKIETFLEENRKYKKVLKLLFTLQLIMRM